MEDVGNICVGCHACVEAETTRIISVASSQCFCDLKTSQEYKVLTTILTTDDPSEAERRFYFCCAPQKLIESQCLILLSERKWHVRATVWSYLGCLQASLYFVGATCMLPTDFLSGRNRKTDIFRGTLNILKEVGTSLQTSSKYSLTKFRNKRWLTFVK